VDENSLISTKEEPPVLEREAPFLEGPLAHSELGGGHAELPQLTLSVPVAPEVSLRPALESEELLVKTPGKVGMGSHYVGRYDWIQQDIFIMF
jgi:histone-lysine N-methyltransferase NSD1